MEITLLTLAHAFKWWKISSLSPPFFFCHARNVVVVREAAAASAGILADYDYCLQASEVGHNVGGDDDINCILNILCNYFACQFFHRTNRVTWFSAKFLKILNCLLVTFPSLLLSSMVGKVKM